VFVIRAAGEIHEESSLALTVEGGTGEHATGRTDVEKYGQAEIEQEYVRARRSCGGGL
jgi:hypothetical protein